jgi:hypothetical protein
MKNAVFWDVTPCGSCKNLRFGGTLVWLRRVRRLQVTANVLSSPILVTLMMEALSSSETSVLTRATRRNNPEDTRMKPVWEDLEKDKFLSLLRLKLRSSITLPLMKRYIDIAPQTSSVMFTLVK